MEDMNHYCIQDMRALARLQERMHPRTVIPCKVGIGKRRLVSTKSIWKALFSSVVGAAYVMLFSFVRNVCAIPRTSFDLAIVSIPFER